MRTDTAAINNIFLPGTILLANLDVTGLLEYALKAAAGGAIWLGFKLAADHIERRKERKNGKVRTGSKRTPKKTGTNGINE